MGITRRRLLQSVAWLPASFWWTDAFAATAKTALVIGNAAYAASPLVNPHHDAEAMHDLLAACGCEVELLIDATRAQMLAAVERLGRRARETRELVLFYFAGHGAQLDWRNYLLPVDAYVDSDVALKNQGLDLAVILEWFTAARRLDAEKSFLIFLDACRNDPFGALYRPPAKGLSQFDAPSGSLLAYATAPGTTAADGTGRHGLYTEHLLRELAQAATPVEVTLKRVRLNVRLASLGAQVPWESTSLEKEVALVTTARKRMSAEEIERQLAAELEHWQRIKSSQRLDDWVEFLRVWPDGRFAEAAQARLDRLLMTQKPAPGAAPPADDVPLAPSGPIGIHIPPAVLVAMRQENPYAAGFYPLGRRYTVGDVCVMLDRDLLTGIEEGRRRLRVTAVDERADRVEINGGKLVWDTLGNTIENERFVAAAPILFFPNELQVGKRWKLAYLTQGKGATAGIEYANDLTAKIERREWIETPAGRFYAFVIEVTGWSRTDQGQAQIELRHWVVPGLDFSVRQERIRRGRKGLIETHHSELIAIRQQKTALSP